VGLKFDIDGQNGKAISRWLSKLGDCRKVFGALGAFVVRRLVLSLPRKGKGETSAPGQPPASHRGGRGLAGSIGHNANADSLVVGSWSEAAALLHFGGVIRPKKAKALTIPISPEADGHRARDFQNTFVLKKSDDPQRIGLIMQDRGEGKDPLALFVLRKSATIPARPWLFWVDADEEYLWHLKDQELATA